ncbi:hypothetical protein PG994_009149 [Apiospora phragmitis]|uniref:Uncharacterized protein n=1 Tax=Apiospora phragmitis TaxID=2905665 RepID=A0ABR1UKU4_9PEZI
MRDVEDRRGAGRGRPRHRNWQPEHIRRAVEDQYSDDDLEAGADDEDDPIDDLPPLPPSPFVVGHLLRKNNRRNNRHRRNDKDNPFLQPPHQQQQQSNFSPSSFQRRQQQQQPQQHQRHPQRNDKYGCHDCRATRKANVRLRNTLHSHLKAATGTLVEWSAEVGVPFGGAADDEMDWQPEPEIRVVIVQQHNDRRRNYYYNNNTGGGFFTNGFPGAAYGGYGGHGGHGAYGGYGDGGLDAAAATWWPEFEMDSLEEQEDGEEPFEVLPEEPYYPMALEPNPFKATTAGSGFANTSGVSPSGTLANQATNPLNSSSGVVPNHSAVSTFGVLAGTTKTPSVRVGRWSRPFAGNQGGLNGHARRTAAPEVPRKSLIRD